MPDNLIRDAGLAMYGEQWKTPLALEIGVSRDSVQDWVQGRMSPRPGVYLDVLAAAQKRAVDLSAVIDQLKARCEISS